MIGIFGSCVTRDLFEHPALRQSLGHYAARCSMISAVADPVAIDEDSVAIPSAWQRRCVMADFQKTCFAQFAAGRLERLVIDLIDERFDLLRVNGSYVTRSSAFDAGRLGERTDFEFETVKRMSAEGCLLFERAAPLFAERVLEMLPAERVVLHRALWCTHYRDGADIHPFPEARLELCLRQNEMLTHGYDALAAAFGGRALEIRVEPERQLADARHRWQLEPFHYEQSYNDHAADWLRDLRDAA